MGYLYLLPLEVLRQETLLALYRAAIDRYLLRPGPRSKLVPVASGGRTEQTDSPHQTTSH